MAYLGLVPREHSSGETRRQGSITKAGNSRARHVLMQAAGVQEEQPNCGGGGGEGVGRVRVGAHAGERGGDRSRAARRLRSIDEDHIALLKEGGRPRHGRRMLDRHYVAGAGQADPKPTRPRSSHLPTNPNSCRSGCRPTGVYQEDSPSKRPSGDPSPSAMKDNETPT